MAALGGLTHSRTLFVDDDGTPMSFYVPPGPLKRQLYPLITHGGGEMCRMQQPGALLLSAPGSAQGAQYVSTAYIMDCVRIDKLLDVDDYRLDGSHGRPRKSQGSKKEERAPQQKVGESSQESDQKQQAKVGGDLEEGDKLSDPGEPVNEESLGEYNKENKMDCSGAQKVIRKILPPKSPPFYLTGRNVFTEKEDVAILLYVRENAPHRGTGVSLWKEMEQKQVVKRTWQAIKNRYFRYLKGKRNYVLPLTDDSSSQEPSDDEEECPQPITKKSRISDSTPCTEKPGVAEKTGEKLSTDTSVEGPSTEKSDAAKTSNVNLPVEERGQEVTEGAIKRSEGNKKSTEMNEEAVSASSKENQDDGADLHIFEIANLEFEVEDTPELEVPKRSFGLKEFVMGEDLPSSQSQTQVDEVSSSPDASESEGLQEALLSMMSEFKLSLCDVTQALLKNNGELAATRHFLQTGSRPDGYPIWVRKDDLDLQKDDAETLKRLIQKYGADNVAKRVAFLAS
uniref:Telomeric repeat-binding factor 2-interacting protein 1 n=1 Tax=Xenopus tropicalis TaxID=8364 RepID=F6WSD5_XENTR